MGILPSARDEADARTAPRVARGSEAVRRGHEAFATGHRGRASEGALGRYPPAELATRPRIAEVRVITESASVNREIKWRPEPRIVLRNDIADHCFRREVLAPQDGILPLETLEEGALKSVIPLWIGIEALGDVRN